MEAVVTLAVLIGAFLLMDARGKVKSLEHRLKLVENELRRRIAIGAEVLREDVPAAPEPECVAQSEPEPMAWQAPPSPVLTEPVAVPPVEVAALDHVPDEQQAAVTPAAEAPVSAPQARVAQKKPIGFSVNFEELFGRKLPIWAGGITLAIAGVLIVKYAIDIGLFGRIFTPGVQAVCGLLFGFGLIGGAEWAHAKRDKVDDPRVAQALSGAGISTLYAVVLVAANAYQLLSPLTAFICLAVVTAMALGLSLRHGAPSALLGLAGGLAAPALTVGITANVPMLALYMSFTIAGLVGVSRAQRWPWLALIALIGGAGWSLWLILAGEALTVMGSLSIGMFVLLLAIAAPLFAFEGARGTLLRSVSALVGAAQLGLLVAMGGFEPLDWGLFVLIAAACQWLAWREESLRIVPTISAALSVLLLLIWPDAETRWLLIIGLSLAAIHALPLLARLWREPFLGRAIALSAIAVAAPIVALRHFWGEDPLVAWVAVAGALAVLAAAAMGWKVESRRGDGRFAWLVATGAGLLVTAALFGAPHWQGPLFTAVIAAATLLLARPSGDGRIEWIGGAYGLLAILLLPMTVSATAELAALAQGRGAGLDGQALLRWAFVAAMAGFVAWRADKPVLREGAGFLAAGLAYGALAQLLPLAVLPLVAPLGVVALAAASRAVDWPRLRAAVLALLGIVAGWALVPLVVWANEAMLSLAGVPMMLADTDIAAGEIARRLFAPALLLAASLWLLREKLSHPAALAGTALAGLLGIVALHCFYRLGFAAQFGSDFVATGLAQRLLWAGLIIGAGFALWKRGGGLLASHAAPALVGIGALHVAWYSLLHHNPLWNDQAVGAIPLANLLAPLFVALPLCVWLLGRMVPVIERFAVAALQPVIMTMVALFAWATLRQGFHGSLLTEAGLDPTEDILRSVLGIALAVGYLLWGIRRHSRIWRIASLVLMLAAVVKVFLFDASGLEGLLRIASFVLLGFSLIGIGWLYSRQLRGEATNSEK